MNRLLYRAALCCFTLFVCMASVCQVRLPRLVSDGMVLQRDTRVKIWGWAGVGEKVAVNFNNKTYNTTASNDGKWEVTLFAMKAGGPYTMEINASNHITIKNILAGDVWVCSGQSNMELPMERVKDRYAAVITQADNPAIRQFNIPTKYVFQAPQEDLQVGSWEMANPQSVLHFTATGYFFAKALYERYHVPIGLIKTSVGGSPAEAWLSEEALQSFPIHLETALKCKDSAYINSIQKKEKVVNDSWYNTIWQQDQGLHNEKTWLDPGYDASSWPTMPVPGYWEDHGLKHVNGVVWFRKEIDVPAAMADKPA